MLRGSVALMILQTVRGVKRAECDHGRIARDLGDDRCGGDGGAFRVTVNDGDFAAGQARALVAVDEAELRRGVQARDGAAHGEQAGAEDIMGIDFLDRGDADGPRDFGVAAEKFLQLRAMLGGELLGVVEVGMLEAVGQNRRGGVDRPGPATAPDFIHARDDYRDAFGPQLALEFPAKRSAALAGWHSRPIKIRALVFVDLSRRLVNPRGKNKYRHSCE